MFCVDFPAILKQRAKPSSDRVVTVAADLRDWAVNDIVAVLCVCFVAGVFGCFLLMLMEPVAADLRDWAVSD